MTPSSRVLEMALNAAGIIAAPGGPESAQGDTSNPWKTWHLQTSSGQWWSLVWPGAAPAPTAQQIATADSVIQATVTSPRVPRTLLDIINDLTALSATQKTEIWTDITSGTPPKWELDGGPNAAAIAVLQLLATSGTLSAADILNAKVRGVAMYLQDNPRYLVQPTFDPTINVAGDQPA